MNSSADVIIVGGGLEGLSIAHSLAERGVTNVRVLERSTLCSGMTAKSSGVVRCHYGVRSLAAMAWHGVQVFSEAGQRVGADVGYRQTGYLVGVGPENTASLEANVTMHQSIGVDVELIDHRTTRQLWPLAHLDDFAAFAYEPRGGHGDAYLTGMAFADAARQRRVRIHQHTTVRELRRGRDGQVIGVRLANGHKVHGGTVMLAAGAWSGPLARSVGVALPIRAQREQLVLVDAGKPVTPVPAFSDLVGLQYLRAEPSGEILVGNSDHSAPEFANADDYVNRADAEFVETTVDKLTHRLPAMPDPRVVASYSGCYDVTPDYNPIIGPSPVDGLFLAAGFSGHGYKISPGVGRLAADLLIDGTSSDPAVRGDDFRFGRFADGTPLVSEHPYAGAGQMR